MIVIIIIISLCLADCCFCKNEKDDEVSGGGEDSMSPVTPVMGRRPESWPDPILTNNTITGRHSRPTTITGAGNNVNKHCNNSKQKAVVGGATKNSRHSSQMSLPQVPTVSL